MSPIARPLGLDVVAMNARASIQQVRRPFPSITVASRTHFKHLRRSDSSTVTPATGRRASQSGAQPLN